MRPSIIVSIAAILGTAWVACSSTNRATHGADAELDGAVNPAGGASDTGGQGGIGGGSDAGGAGKIGAGGNGGTGGASGMVTGGNGGTGGAGGKSRGTGGTVGGTEETGGTRAGTGGGAGSGAASGSPAKDASASDVPADVALASDATPPRSDGGPSCPEQPPIDTSGSGSVACSLEMANLQCFWAGPSDAGPGCRQTSTCWCAIVPSGGGAMDCYWNRVMTVCPDAGLPPSDASGAVGQTGAGGGTQSCGGKVCASGEACCGPPECGQCINALFGGMCPSSCSASSCGPSGAPCNADEICVDVKVTTGSTVSATATCVLSACAGQTLSCGCIANTCQAFNAQTPCSAANPTSGLITCTSG